MCVGSDAFKERLEDEPAHHLDVCGSLGLDFDMMQTSFFLSRQQVVPGAGGPSTMWRWRERMFAAMARNAGNVTDYFGIPTNRVIELGTRVEI